MSYHDMLPDMVQQNQDISMPLAGAIKENITFMVKIGNTAIDLMQDVVNVHEKAVASVLDLIKTYEKRLSDVQKERPHCQSESYMNFIRLLFEQISNQAKFVQASNSSLTECVINPLKESGSKSKEILKECFKYVDSFEQKIRKENENLNKSYGKYWEAANKVKYFSDGTGPDKQELMYLNSHNAFLLQLSVSNGTNRLLTTHVLPEILNNIKKGESEFNNSFHHHLKYMNTTQKDILSKFNKSFEEIDGAADAVDLVGDLEMFIDSTKQKIKKVVPQECNPNLPYPGFHFSHNVKLLYKPLPKEFVVNPYTKPYLQRRYKALTDEISALIKSISNVKSTLDQINSNDIKKYLNITEKEGNLHLALKQMELYTPKVTKVLDEESGSLLASPSSSQHDAPTEKPHNFKDFKLLLPVNCNYCGKLVTQFSKGYICKNCKMCVHKKCSTNVMFCEDFKESYDGSNDLQQSTPQQMKTPANNLIDLNDSQTNPKDVTDRPPSRPDHGEYIYIESDPLCNPTPPIYSHVPCLYPDINGMMSQSSNNESTHDLSASKFIRSNDAMIKPASYDQHTNVQSLPEKSSNSQILNPSLNLAYVESGDDSIEPDVTAAPIYACLDTDESSITDTRPEADASQVGKSHCVALYPYRSSEECELCFTAGTIIEILERGDIDGWWKGISNQTEGYFPSSYVMEMPNTDHSILRALYSFTAQYGTEELSIEEGEILVLIENHDEWLQVKSSSSEGLVPTSYIEYL